MYVVCVWRKIVRIYNNRILPNVRFLSVYGEACFEELIPTEWD